MYAQRAPPAHTMAWFWLLSSATSTAAIGCQANLPDNPQISFYCERSGQCPRGQICRDQQCVTYAAASDGSAPVPDAAPRDASAGDLVRDAQPVDRGAADRGADAAGRDRTGAEAATPDAGVIDSSTPDGCVAPSGPGWWDPAYATRFPLAISATDGHYTLELVLAQQQAAAVHGASQANGRDLRIVRHGAQATEIDREISTYRADSVVLRFRIQESGGYPGGDQIYFVYAGNPDPGAPPTDSRNIYLLFENFELMTVGSDGTAVFSPATADWSVVDDGGNLVYRVDASGRTPAALTGLSVDGAVFAGRVKYNAVGDGNAGLAGLAFRCSDVSSGATTCTGGAVLDQNDRAGIMSWSNGTFDQFGSGYSDFAPASGHWYHFQVAFAGNAAGFWIDGAPQETASAISTSGFSIALVGVGVDACFDDIVVRKLTIPEPRATLGEAQPRCQ
ncbi:MAG: hypothetical protein JXR83_21810 [Deltaproteobacteria bacterium]|nr:hypothetical protein [Deltaproteobacteria bacterium]